MGTFTTLDGQSPVDGSVAQPVASGRYGMHDPLRQQVAVVIGQAYSFKDSTNPADRLSIYLFGDALARPELGGVIAQDGNAPTMSIAAATGDSDCATGIFCGYAPILLAPGEVVKRGQHLEPIPTGANQAMWRTSPTGPAIARQYYDNSGGTEGALISADLLLESDPSGFEVVAVGPSAALTGVTVETAYGLPAAATRTIKANTLRVGDRLRAVACVLSGNIAAGANTVKGRINGIAGALVFTAPAVTFAAADVVQYESEWYVSAVGESGNISQSGGVCAGVPGTATKRAVVGQIAIDTTVDNVVTITNTPNNIADTSTLLFLSVDKL